MCGITCAGEVPYKCPLMGLLAFFTVVASSQISPHIASWASFLYLAAKDVQMNQASNVFESLVTSAICLRIVYRCKGTHFCAHFMHPLPIFFMGHYFFNYLLLSNAGCVGLVSSCASSSCSSLILRPSVGCIVSGAICASGSRTKLRLCIRGWGMVSLSQLIVMLP